jgi:hypothetical protein
MPGLTRPRRVTKVAALGELDRRSNGCPSEATLFRRILRRSDEMTACIRIVTIQGILARSCDSSPTPAACAASSPSEAPEKEGAQDHPSGLPRVLSQTWTAAILTTLLSCLCRQRREHDPQRSADAGTLPVCTMCGAGGVRLKSTLLSRSLEMFATKPTYVITALPSA